MVHRFNTPSSPAVHISGSLAVPPPVNTTALTTSRWPLSANLTLKFPESDLVEVGDVPECDCRRFDESDSFRLWELTALDLAACSREPYSIGSSARVSEDAESVSLLSKSQTSVSSVVSTDKAGSRRFKATSMPAAAENGFVSFFPYSRFKDEYALR